MLPLQVPGGPELLVIALIVLILAAIVAVLIYLSQRLGTSVSDKQRQTQELEEHVAELNERVAELEENLESEDR